MGELKEGLLVQKNGRTTGHTWGYVSHFVRIKHASLALVFENDVLIEGANMRFSDRGDSSSYIYDEFGNLVAILWGGLETTDGRYFTIAHPIKPVFEDLNLTLTKPKIVEEPTVDNELNETPVIDVNYITENGVDVKLKIQVDINSKTRGR